MSKALGWYTLYHFPYLQWGNMCPSISHGHFITSLNFLTMLAGSVDIYHLTVHSSWFAQHAFLIWQVQSVTIHATNNYFVTASLDSTWCFYELASGLCLTQVSTLSLILHENVLALFFWDLCLLVLSICKVFVGWRYFGIFWRLHFCSFSSWWSDPWNWYHWFSC